MSCLLHSRLSSQPLIISALLSYSFPLRYIFLLHFPPFTYFVHKVNMLLSFLPLSHFFRKIQSFHSVSFMVSFSCPFTIVSLFPVFLISLILFPESKGSSFCGSLYLCLFRSIVFFSSYVILCLSSSLTFVSTIVGFNSFFLFLF